MNVLRLRGLGMRLTELSRLIILHINTVVCLYLASTIALTTSALPSGSQSI